MIRPDTAFLDRDGTINVKAPDGNYVVDPEAVQLLPGAAAAIRELNLAGVRVIVVTNQRCIARGLLSPAGYGRVTARLRDLLAHGGAWLDAVYTCPHAASGCRCRKPEPGLLLAAAADDRRIDLARSVVIGDAETDVAAGAAAGTATIRLAQGGIRASGADAVTADLASAVRLILDEKWQSLPERQLERQHWMSRAVGTAR